MKPRFALILLAASLGCESADRVSPNTAEPTPQAARAAAPAATGIPFGNFNQPLSAYGSLFNGGHLNPQKPESLLSYLSTIRAAKGHVVLALAGGSLNYTNADGTFNLDRWKLRQDRYYNAVDLNSFNSYIADGTVIGNFLIDQPNCPECWGGQVIPQDMVDSMAKYSKQLWPAMTTIARADPTWLQQYPNAYAYLDTGWAQYVMRKGDVNTYLSQNAAAAQAKGLGLVVGLNYPDGGVNSATLTATQIKNFGSVLLGSSQACAFISWKYDATFFAQSDIASALDLLSKKAKRHAATKCAL